MTPLVQACVTCGVELSAERAEIYSHCTAPKCVSVWRAHKFEGWSVALLPKQGFTPLPSDHPFFSTGKSSGRT